MSFNLQQFRQAKENKKYVPDSKVNKGENVGDDHISRRLEKSDHKKAPNQVNEGQLEDYRIESKEQTTEQRLEEVRTGAVEALIEKQLNDSKSTMVKHRNASAHEGDMIKLEEKRLTQDYVNEKEPYKPASEVPSKGRWWEVKSKDGLKLAKSDEVVKTAAIEDEELYTPFYHGEDTDVKDFFEGEEDAPSGNNMPSLLEQEEKLSQLGSPEEDDITQEMSLITYTPNATIPSLYMVLGFDPTAFGNDRSAIIAAAIKSVRKHLPLLADRLTEDDLNISSSGPIGSVSIRMLGDELEGVFGEEENADIFKEQSYKKKMIDDILMARGVLELTKDIGDIGEDEILDMALTFVAKKHAGLTITKDAFDLSKIGQGIIEYVAPMIDAREASGSNFPIVTSEKKN